MNPGRRYWVRDAMYLSITAILLTNLASLRCQKAEVRIPFPTYRFTGSQP